MRWHLLLGLAISAACLAWLLGQVDLPSLGRLLLQLSPWYFLAVAALMAWVFFLRSQRWQILLRPLKRCPIGPLYSANLIGFMANNVLPARLGEIVRAYAVNRLCAVPVSGALATLVIERILDGMAILAFFFLALFFTDPDAQAGAFNVAYLRGAGLFLLAGYLGILALLAALWRWPSATSGQLARLAGRLSPRLGEKTASLLAGFTQGLGLLGQGRHLPLLIAQSLAMWLLMLLTAYVFLPAVGLPHRLLMAAMALVGGSLAAAVPSGPGCIGTTQLAVMWSLMLTGADQERAAAFSLVYWAALYFPVTAAGLVEMLRRGLSLGSLRGGGGKK
ncbi:MAG: flippase-like domain-containing protein [Desulfarculaceae bacterium]|nr:flippase-like domain-containing protein [Desulfarculaceae bacterium]MCF8048318.1 flippase-like domain-containing protein [Desulfarculaceae bacterium]MCF8098619.1 flippase-like domain-containing protein [Desulfarculaceae bacterium]MCF8121331.1 flippase-like domain-containing protein [Desulfarculaceae bacterium]